MAADDLRPLIHETRVDLAARLQREHERGHDACCEALTDLGLNHPYALEEDGYRRMFRVPAFKLGGEGPDARPSDRVFYYQITSVRKVVQNTTWVTVPNSANRNDELWHDLRDDTQHSDSGWLDLARYANGVLRGWRGFTWWTTLDPQTLDIMLAAYRLGMVSEWIAVYAVILRVAASAVTGTIPTSIDGFDSEIFRPVPMDGSAPTGRTIALSRNSSLTDDGEEEFLLVDIPVGAVELLPILIDRPRRQQPLLLEEVRGPLYSFLKAI